MKRELGWDMIANELNVLILDDDEVDRERYKRCLKHTAFSPSNIHEASTSQNAQQLLEQHQFQCMLIDYNLPGTDGLSFLKKLKNDPMQSDLIVLFFTGEGTEEIAANALKYGADDYIPKSKLNAQALNHAIETSLEKKSLKKQINEQYAKLDYMAHHDILTQCLNRRAFYEALKKQLSAANRYQRLAALLFIDLDNFKLINDQYGHGVGDELLICLVKQIKTCCRCTDIIGRMGGDEFAVGLSEISHPLDGARVAEKIIRSLEAPFHIHGKDIAITVSIGLACYPDAAESTEDLIQCADIAMYRAKESGRNRSEFFTQALNDLYKEKNSLEQNLKQAINKQELFLMYQPQYDLKRKHLVGIESLIRWRHPEKGLISPDKFIPTAEESNLIQAIDNWVIEQAITQYLMWLKQKINPPKIAINISAKQFSDTQFLQNILKTISDYGIIGHYLELEITETALGRDIAMTKSVLQELQRYGVSIAIDDFGTGYSSLAQLVDLPSINTLKIDKSFISKLEESDQADTITKSIIDIGHHLNLNLIAEGIENKSQLDFLYENGCDQAQGFYLSHPLSAQEMEQRLKEISQHHPRLH